MSPTPSHLDPFAAVVARLDDSHSHSLTHTHTHTHSQCESSVWSDAPRASRLCGECGHVTGACRCTVEALDIASRVPVESVAPRFAASAADAPITPHSGRYAHVTLIGDVLAGDHCAGGTRRYKRSSDNPMAHASPHPYLIERFESKYGANVALRALQVHRLVVASRQLRHER